ncbi:hypothetical protein ENBRE01_2544 [Enteropsectra breve]|nr:hypothetical protein ENBRE01_2544 [Enteropsectra breve]
MGNHDTSECWALNKMKQKGLLKNTNNIQQTTVSEYEPSEDEENDTFNKNTSSYTCNTFQNLKNPFFSLLQMENNTHSCILDTGADISLINTSCLPKDTLIYKITEKAGGITGKILKLSARPWSLTPILDIKY